MRIQHFQVAYFLSKIEVLLCCVFSAGFYCNSYGLSEPTGACTAGYFCPEGQNSSTPIEYKCTPGHFCQAGSITEQTCPPGYYQDQFTQVGFALSNPAITSTITLTLNT